MTRTIQQIQLQMDSEQALQPALNELNSPSQTAIYRLWKFITSTAHFIHESLWDIKKTEIETIIAAAPVGTEAWIQDQMFKFQYDSTTPQILSLINFVPSYDPIDESKRIISECSIDVLTNKVVSVKLAKNNPPEKLAAQELTATQGYLNKILFAGVSYIAYSYDPDYIFVEADIKYDGQYSTSISASTIAAINNYLTNIPFDGYLKIVSLTDAIQNVPGFVDLKIKNVAVRPNSVPFSSTTYIVSNYTTTDTTAPLFAGYCVPEPAPNSFASSLNFIPA